MHGVGIVIVTHGSGDEIGPCLDAALPVGAEIVVVDNASVDRTREEVRRRGVRLIANGENRGFAAAVNQGIRSLSSPLILLLNPDAVLVSGLDKLAACCQSPDAGAAGGMLLGSDGAPQIGFMVRRFPTACALAFEALLINRLWPHNPVNWNYRCMGMDYSVLQVVEQPAGAFLMVRREAWEAAGGFDEGFRPLWFEDVDFCKRVADLGYRLYFVPEAVAKHTGGHSIPKIAVEKRRLYWYGSLLRYAARHFRPRTVRSLSLAVMLGSLVRVFAEVALSRSLKPIAVYIGILKLTGRCLLSPGEAA